MVSRSILSRRAELRVLKLSNPGTVRLGQTCTCSGLQPRPICDCGVHTDGRQTRCAEVTPWLKTFAKYSISDAWARNVAAAIVGMRVCLLEEPYNLGTVPISGSCVDDFQYARKRSYSPRAPPRAPPSRASRADASAAAPPPPLLSCCG